MIAGAVNVNARQLNRKRMIVNGIFVFISLSLALAFIDSRFEKRVDHTADSPWRIEHSLSEDRMPAL